jgi:hypothetical protein
MTEKEIYYYKENLFRLNLAQEEMDKAVFDYMSSLEKF